MTLADSLTLRRATLKDAEFAFGVLKETMREYAISTWGTWWEEQSRQETAEQVGAGRTEIIELDRVPIGIQLIERSSTHIQLAQLYIAKAYQRRELGSELLRRLIEESKATHLPIRLQVLVVNPARLFYERMAFVVIETAKERLFMERKP